MMIAFVCDYTFILCVVCYQNALPFIGFGFLDNVIMISVVSNREVTEVMGTDVYFDVIVIYKTSSMFNITY